MNPRPTITEEALSEASRTFIASVQSLDRRVTEKIIRVFRDGDQTCAIIGQMPTETAVGFGDDVKAALTELEKKMDNLEGVCPICWNETERDEMEFNTLHSCPNCGWGYDEVKSLD